MTSARNNARRWRLAPPSASEAHLALAADIEALPDAQGLDELGSSLDAILSEVQQIYDETTEALQCE